MTVLEDPWKEIFERMLAELGDISTSLVEIRDELTKRSKPSIGFRGELGWQCLACGEDFETLRQAETHLRHSVHCHKCDRAIATEGRVFRGGALLCDQCTEAFMDRKLRRLFAASKPSNTGAGNIIPPPMLECPGDNRQEIWDRGWTDGFKQGFEQAKGARS